MVLAAADTFRAAAGEQLKEWANRAGVDMIGGQEGSDPAAVIYDAVAAAKARNADVTSLRYGRKTAQQEEPDGRTAERSTGSWKKNIRTHTVRHW